MFRRLRRTSQWKIRFIRSKKGTARLLEDKDKGNFNVNIKGADRCLEVQLVLIVQLIDGKL